MKILLALSVTILLFASSLVAQEEEEAAAPIELEEIVTIGTRVPERSRLDSPVPVDVINEDAIRKTGHTEVGRVLQTLAPSFNFSSSSISDGTDALRPATLRGAGAGSGACSRQRETAARERVDTRQHVGGSRYGGRGHERDSGERYQTNRDPARWRFGAVWIRRVGRGHKPRAQG